MFGKQKAANATDFNEASPVEMPEPIRHSGGSDEKPGHSRRAQGQFPRPSVNYGKGNSSKTGNDAMGEGESTTQKHPGLKQPKVIERSGHHAGGDNDMPLSRDEGTGVPPMRERMFSPEDRNDWKPKEGHGSREPLGLEMAQVNQYSGEGIRTKKLGSKSLRWTDRGYAKPSRLEGES